MNSWIKDLIAITVIVGTLFGVTLGQYPLAAPDGARYAEIPREMVVTGDYLTPHLNGVKYFEKPPLFYWLQTIPIKLLGANEASVSIINALFAFGTILLTYWLARSLYGRLTGLLSTAVLSTCALVFALTRIITLDVTLTFFLTGALAAFLLATKCDLGGKRKALLIISYFLVGCAVITKGLVGIMFPGITILVWLTINQEWRNLKNYYPIAGIFIFLITVLPWHILVQIKNPEFFRFYFLEQHFLRYFTDYASRSQKWWFFPALLVAGLYPWITFLPSALINTLKRIKQEANSKQTILLLVWTSVIYIFYTFSQSKLIPYILPVLPPLAIVIGKYFAHIWTEKKSWQIGVSFYAFSLLSFLLSIAATSAVFGADLSEHVITKQNLVTVAILMLANALLTSYYYRTKGVVTSLITIVMITSATWLYISPKISTINRQSIKPLITVLQQKLKPEDEVISYAGYYQDLSFYLNRTVTVAAFHGELDFGTKHQDTSSWMIDNEEFWRRWNSERKIYLITGESHYRNLFAAKKSDKMRIVAKLWDTLLVTNTN